MIYRQRSQYLYNGPSLVHGSGMEPHLESPVKGGAWFSFESPICLVSPPARKAGSLTRTQPIHPLECCVFSHHLFCGPRGCCGGACLGRSLGAQGLRPVLPRESTLRQSHTPSPVGRALALTIAQSCWFHQAKGLTRVRVCSTPPGRRGEQTGRPA